MSRKEPQNSIPTLHIKLHTDNSYAQSVSVMLIGQSGANHSFTKPFCFTLSPQQQENMRWYLEDYWQYDFEPHHEIAAQVEQEMKNNGEQLFREVFATDDVGEELWLNLQPIIHCVHLEVSADLIGTTSIPWELMQEPGTTEPLALRVREFLRVNHRSPMYKKHPQSTNGPLRILLVICRPKGTDDIPFRSTALPLLDALEEAKPAIELTVLRPPTFNKMSKILHQSYREGRPYHIVHFDGHGAYSDIYSSLPEEEIAGQRRESNSHQVHPLHPAYPRKTRHGQHGYLMFEKSAQGSNLRVVDGLELGKLLARTGVKMLVLEACQTAYAVTPSQPLQINEGEAYSSTNHSTNHVYAFGSLAQEVSAFGIPQVVAMRYSVRTDASAEFVVGLYQALLRGHTLGEAARYGRQQMYNSQMQYAKDNMVRPKDWVMPVIFENRPSTPLITNTSASTLVEPVYSTPLPAPSIEFAGGDKPVLALDRDFDRHQVILLGGLAGSGKTAVAAEFAKWYSRTAGITGAVLITTFANVKEFVTLSYILDTVGRAFTQRLAQMGIVWSSLKREEEKRELTLQLLGEGTVLWIWDGVEKITAPQASHEATSRKELKKLTSFLRAAKRTKAKFLLTSQHHEKAWLGKMPFRFALPSSPASDMNELTYTFCREHSWWPNNQDGLYTLIQCSRGNPLTLIAVLEDAIAQKLDTLEQFKDYVARFKRGEVELGDHNSPTIRIALNNLADHYQTDLSEEEREQLAILYLFQGYINPATLYAMDASDGTYHLPDAKDVSPDEWTQLLYKAERLGLVFMLSDGSYLAHPLLPRLLKDDFNKRCELAGVNGRAEFERAFIKVMYELAIIRQQQFERGVFNELRLLAEDEDNLLNAWRISRRYGWLREAAGHLHALALLYEHTAQLDNLNHVIKQIRIDYFADDDAPVPGLENEWATLSGWIIEWLLRLEMFEQAEGLLSAHISWSRKQVKKILPIELKGQLLSRRLNEEQKREVHRLGAMLYLKGRVQVKRKNPDCITTLNEAKQYFEIIGNKRSLAMVFNEIGNAYLEVEEIYNINAAERAYVHKISLLDEDDTLSVASVIGQLGAVAYARAMKATRGSEKQHYLQCAREEYERVLGMMPREESKSIAIIYNRLGVIYKDLGDSDLAFRYFNNALDIRLGLDDMRVVADIHYHIALTLWELSRDTRAVNYAKTALQIFRELGLEGTPVAQRVIRLIAEINQSVISEPER